MSHGNVLIARVHARVTTCTGCSISLDAYSPGEYITSTTKEGMHMNFYSLGKAIYLTARYEITGSQDKAMFAELAGAKFFFMRRRG